MDTDDFSNLCPGHSLLTKFDCLTPLFLECRWWQLSCINLFHPRILTDLFRGRVNKYLSSDNDRLFRYHRWQVNLRILEI